MWFARKPNTGGMKQLPHIGSRHLYADQSLGALRSKMYRCGMDNGGIDRGASSPTKIRPARLPILPSGRKGTQSAQYHSDPQPYHLRIAESHSEKSTDCSSGRDPYKKQAGKTGGCFRRNSPMKHKIAAGYWPSCLLKRTIAENVIIISLDPGIFTICRSESGLSCSRPDDLTTSPCAFSREAD